jgi:SAM-dependent methyltransferase
MNEGNWIPKQTTGNPFFDECAIIVDDEELFKIFKQNPTFCSIIGNDVRSKDISDKLYNRVRQTEIYSDIEKYRTNDIIGTPVLYNYSDIGLISPGTLYFMDVLNDIKNKFGNIHDFNILEIGSGYGGQAKILLDYGVKSYTCIDVNEPLNLCRKYLSNFKYTNVDFMVTEAVEYNTFDQYDLVISNWCLSEFDIEGIQYYISKIINFIPNGYFLMNIWDSERKQFIIDALSTKFMVSVEEEDTKTNPNNNFLLTISKF